MIIFVEQKSFASVVETPEEQAMSDIELRNQCLRYLNDLRGRIFINKATGIPIEVNREIKNEMISKIHVNIYRKRPIARIKFLSLKIIRYFLTDSNPDILYEPDYKKRDIIEYSHIFKYECQINGTRFTVRIRTRKKKTQTTNRLYFLTFEDLTLTEKK
jgi:hypothetical protein